MGRGEPVVVAVVSELKSCCLGLQAKLPCSQRPFPVAQALTPRSAQRWEAELKDGVPAVLRTAGTSGPLPKLLAASPQKCLSCAPSRLERRQGKVGLPVRTLLLNCVTLSSQSITDH